MSSRFGKSFSVTTFGESHGLSVGVVIDGVPGGLRLDLAKVQQQLDRRRPGQSALTSTRNEADRVACHSGIEDGVTLGSPVTLIVANADQRPSDYAELADLLRPSHADFVTLAKYGVKSKSGGGRASARETIGRVAAGAVAEQMLTAKLPDFSVVAWVQAVGTIACPPMNEENLSRADVDTAAVRCPDAETASKMSDLIEAARTAGDSVGGIVRCVIRGVPAGLGEPVFDKLEADLAKAMLSIPATKGFEIGSGFAGTQMRGSEHNDEFVVIDGRVRTATNRSGGVQGGISNGEMIVFNVAFKPVATIAKPQNTVTASKNHAVLEPRHGRHDPCVLPRAVAIVEGMAAIVLADHWLRQTQTRGLDDNGP